MNQIALILNNTTSAQAAAVALADNGYHQNSAMNFLLIVLVAHLICYLLSYLAFVFGNVEEYFNSQMIYRLKERCKVSISAITPVIITALAVQWNETGKLILKAQDFKLPIFIAIASLMLLSIWNYLDLTACGCAGRS